MAVSRISTTGSSSTDFWNYSQDTLPNGTIDIPITTTSTHSSNTGRILILHYTGESNTAITGTMTIGGVSPSYEYTNILDRAVDLQSYVGIWLDADIESMSGTTASTSGTWPTTSAEVWSYGMYMNVDQDSPLSLGENWSDEGTSPGTYDVTTTSTTDDYIVVLGGANSSAGSISNADTLFKCVDIDDDVGNNMRHYVYEGPGGDNTTTMTCGNGSHYSYGWVLKYKKYAIRMETGSYLTNRNTTSSSFTIIRAPDIEMPSTNTTKSREYFTCFTAGHNNLDSTAAAVNDINFYQNQVSASNFTQTNNREPRRSSGNASHQHFAFDRITTSSTFPNNNDFRGWMRSDGTNRVQVNISNYMVLDMSDLTENTDYQWDEDTTSYTTLNNTTWTEGANVSIGTDGDWLIFAYAHILCDTTSAAIKLKITVNDVDNGNALELEGEDTVEEFCYGFIMPIANLTVSDIVKLEFQTDSAASGTMDIDQNRIFALNMSSFDDHFMLYNASDTTISTGDQDETVATHNHTTSLTAESDYIVGTMALHNPTDSSAYCSIRLEESTDGVLCGGQTECWMQNNQNDITPLGPIWKPYIDQTDNNSKTFNTIVYEQDGTIAMGTIIDTWLWGFTTRFAPAAASGRTMGAIAGEGGLAGAGGLAGSRGGLAG